MPLCYQEVESMTLAHHSHWHRQNTVLLFHADGSCSEKFFEFVQGEADVYGHAAYMSLHPEVSDLSLVHKFHPNASIHECHLAMFHPGEDELMPRWLPLLACRAVHLGRSVVGTKKQNSKSSIKDALLSISESAKSKEEQGTN